MKGIMNTHYPSGLPEMAVASILKDVLKGLQYIHENHMIHKYDLKLLFDILFKIIVT